MNIPFKKMHGAGNDFILFRQEDIKAIDNNSDLALKCCHRHFGIGADGIMIVAPSEIADVKMLYFNSDGSPGNMCGNGIRCFSKYVYDEGIVKALEFRVETLAGVLVINATNEGDKVKSVKVNMGRIIYEPESIPVITNETAFINKEIIIEDRSFIITTVLMGVPHTVILTDDISVDTVMKYGPRIEKHPLFPRRTNVNFGQILDRGHIKVRTWERGAGYTLACGTGVTSVCGVAHDLGLVDKEIEITIDGGNLLIKIEEDNEISMEGPAADICRGIFFFEK